MENDIFGSGFQSALHIDAIWNIIKNKIKNTYYIIPNKNLFEFIREEGYKKYSIRDKNYDDKINNSIKYL